MRPEKLEAEIFEKISVMTLDEFLTVALGFMEKNNMRGFGFTVQAEKPETKLIVTVMRMEETTDE